LDFPVANLCPLGGGLTCPPEHSLAAPCRRRVKVVLYIYTMKRCESSLDASLIPRCTSYIRDLPVSCSIFTVSTYLLKTEYRTPPEEKESLVPEP